MKDDDFGLQNERLRVALPAWLMTIGGTAASLALEGAFAEIGLVVALLGFIRVLVLMHRESGT